MQTLLAPHPMQKNSCFSGSNATGSPHPQARGVGAREACTVRRWYACASAFGTLSDVFVPFVMETTGLG